VVNIVDVATGSVARLHHIFNFNKTKQNKTKQNKTKMKKNHKNNSIHYLTRNTNKHQQARQKKISFFYKKR